MPRVQGAYELGKALLEKLGEAGKKVDTYEKDGKQMIASSERNRQLLSRAVVGALMDANFIRGALAWSAATQEAEQVPS